MAVDLVMPALSPTMEKGTLARWLVAVGDTVKPGDLLAEIETDKATMEFEAIDDGVVAEIVIQDGTQDVPVGTIIARIGDSSSVPAPPEKTLSPSARRAAKGTGLDPALIDGTGRNGRVTKEDILSASGLVPPALPTLPAAPGDSNAADRQLGIAVATAEEKRPRSENASSDYAALSPLVRRIAEAKSLDLSSVSGSGPGGRIILADVAPAAAPAASVLQPSPPSPAPSTQPVPLLSSAAAIPDVPHDTLKLSGMRKTIARRLTESKQQVPHIYLTVDVRLDALLRLRSELNEALVPRGIKLSVNDMIIKAQALALIATPACNVQYTPDTLIRFSRADISVAVSIPDGLITPIIVDAGSASLSTIATSMKALAARAREGKLQPSEYQGGTASLSNLGMFRIKQFDAVINPPQAMILAVGAGEERVVPNNGEISIQTVMSATGSFDHRAIDGADAAAFMSAFRSIVENPLELIG